LTPTQTAAAPNALHIPETIGAITIAYNLPGITTGLKLTGPIVANMYLGTITTWNDPQITSINPGVNLPNQNIVLVRRSDSSGTTSWFTKYLCLSSTTWASQVSNGTTVPWPATTVGQSGNNGVAAYVEATSYSIGYVELAYALTYTMKVASLQNPVGNFITPSLATTTAAAASLPSGLPAGTGDWSQVTILNAPGAQAYPIVNPTYLLVYKELNVVTGMTQDKATQIVQYLWFVTHDGQSQAASNSYATLPSNLVQIDETSLNSITFNGQPLVTH
jgi:phosphate ABC transporter phosphate-binding protein